MYVGVGLGVGLGVSMEVINGTLSAVGVGVEATVGVAVRSGCAHAASKTAPTATPMSQDNAFLLVPLVAGLSHRSCNTDRTSRLIIGRKSRPLS